MIMSEKGKWHILSGNINIPIIFNIRWPTEIFTFSRATNITNYINVDQNCRCTDHDATL